MLPRLLVERGQQFQYPTDKLSCTILVFVINFDEAQCHILPYTQDMNFFHDLHQQLAYIRQ